MSIFADIAEQSSECLEATHADTLTLQPGAFQVLGTVQQLDAVPQKGARQTMPQQFSIGEVLPTHAIHIRRKWLVNVNVKDVATIYFGMKRYRVMPHTDDPANPEVAFYCLLS